MNRSANPFKYPEVIDGGEAARQIAEIYAQNRGKKDNSAAHGRAVLKAAIGKNFIEPEKDDGWWDDKLETSIYEKEKIKEAFHESTELFGKLDIIPPEPFEFAINQVDFEALAQAMREMEKDGDSPAVIIAPNLKLEEWEVLYDHLAKDDACKWKPSYAASSNLLVDEDTAQRWNEFQDIPSENGIYIPHVHQWDSDIDWTIRCVSETNSPMDVNGVFNEVGSNHPSVSEYLTLQALRIKNNRTPIDTHPSQTWIQNKHNKANGTVAGWSTHFIALYIESRPTDFYSYHTGRRMGRSK